MLPMVSLRDVSRDDVDRIGWWLDDTALSSRWFGHYACGDPVHRGYEPEHMLEAGELEWARVFSGSQRLIYSIYSVDGEHVGEAQLLLDEHQGGELSLLIGLKELWHHGHGTATVLALLDKGFGELDLKRVWVNVPEDNSAALGLFQKLGFLQEQTRELCTRPDGRALHACILSMSAMAYGTRRPADDPDRETVPVVTITGLPGSPSAAIAVEVSRLLGCRFIDDEISEALQQRLRCSAGEFEAFEASQRSMWTRLLSAVVVPTQWSASYDMGYMWYRPEQLADYEIRDDRITRKQYLEALGAAVRRLSVQGDVVMHGHGSHLFVPRTASALNVFVTMSQEARQARIEADHALSPGDAESWLRQTDMHTQSIFRNLFGSELLDMRRYDLTVNMDRVSFTKAAQIIVGALGMPVVGIGGGEPAPEAAVEPAVS